MRIEKPMTKTIQQHFYAAIWISLFSVLLGFGLKVYLATVIEKESLALYYTAIDIFSFSLLVLIGFRSSMVVSYNKLKEDGGIVNIFRYFILVAMLATWAFVIPYVKHQLGVNIDYERYVSASKRMGTVAYDAPTAELAEFTERMFEIFNNDALDSSSMQDLAFEVLEQTRNLPFKLPQEAIYILRVSAIIEGLGTTYIENFNGIKDILPILQDNIPRALGAKESIIETIIDEFKNLPLDVRAFRNAVYRISEENLSVELSKPQLEVLEKSLKESLSPVITGIVLMLSSLFVLMYDHDLENYALVLFGAGVLRLLFKKG